MVEVNIEKEVRASINSFLRSRICVMGGIGTGNLVVVGHRTFIATCKHVAEDYFAVERPYVILRHNRRIPTKNLVYFGSTNDDLDLAVLEVMNEAPVNAFYGPDSFEVIDDFAVHDFHLTNLLVCGLPKDLTWDKPDGLYHDWLHFTTLPSEKQEANHLYVRYEMDSAMKEDTTGQEMGLPGAKGLSGGFVLALRQFDAQSSQLWTPDLAKVVAVQSACDKRTYLKATNVKHLIPLLPSA